jgi:hypothetical protein
MRMSTPRVCLAIVCAAATAVGAAVHSFFDDFSAMPVGTCHPDGTAIGPWTFVYDGYGCNAFVSASGNTMLMERPKAATRRSQTHAGLVVGPEIASDFTLEVATATARQLRTGSAPNPWEVAWVLWHYADNVHFYYVIAKPNGWELGKADPAYPGAQRFLATGAAPQFPIGQWYQIRVTQVGTTFQVFVNGLLLTTFTDNERPYLSGRVGLYVEDAEAYFDNVSVTTTNVELVPDSGVVRPPPGKRGGKK